MFNSYVELPGGSMRACNNMGWIISLNHGECFSENRGWIISLNHGECFSENRFGQTSSGGSNQLMCHLFGSECLKGVDATWKHASLDILVAEGPPNPGANSTYVYNYIYLYFIYIYIYNNCALILYIRMCLTFMGVSIAGPRMVARLADMNLAHWSLMRWEIVWLQLGQE